MTLKITGEQENAHEEEKQSMAVFIRLLLVRILISHFGHLPSQGNQIVVNSRPVDKQEVFGIVRLII